MVQSTPPRTCASKATRVNRQRVFLVCLRNMPAPAWRAFHRGLPADAKHARAIGPGVNLGSFSARPAQTWTALANQRRHPRQATSKRNVAGQRIRFLGTEPGSESNRQHGRLSHVCPVPRIRKRSTMRYDYPSTGATTHQITQSVVQCVNRLLQKRQLDEVARRRLCGCPQHAGVPAALHRPVRSGLLTTEECPALPAVHRAGRGVVRTAAAGQQPPERTVPGARAPASASAQGLTGCAVRAV